MAILPTGIIQAGKVIILMYSALQKLQTPILTVPVLLDIKNLSIQVIPPNLPITQLLILFLFFFFPVFALGLNTNVYLVVAIHEERH